MELYSWAEVVKEFNHLYNEAIKNGFEPSDGLNLFDFITLDMMLRGAGNHIGYKFPEDLKSFRSTLNRLKNENKAKTKKKSCSRLKLIFAKTVKRQSRKNVKPEELKMEYISPAETLEEQVKRLGLNPDTYF